ncbi:hypothetical protein LNP74_26515 [Klebsiella pneumoniae subsp. pneumoniae]|nr:hypothetical protein [Klebsiella pneumoniae subsp. pneumoniae]
MKPSADSFTVTTDGVLEEGVATIDDDVALSRYGLRESIALSVPRPLSPLTGCGVEFRGFNKLLHGIVRDQFLAWIFGNHFFGLFTGAC